MAKKKQSLSKEISPATFETLLNESDRGCVILGASNIETLLTEIHRFYLIAKIEDEKLYKEIWNTLTGQNGPLNTFAGKIQIAFACGLIPFELYDCLEMVRAMRNEAAHCDFTFRFNDAGIKPLLAKIRGYKFMQELIVRYPYPMIETVPEVKREFILGHGEVLCGLGRVIMTYTPSVAAREQQWRSAK